MGRVTRQQRDGKIRKTNLMIAGNMISNIRYKVVDCDSDDGFGDLLHDHLNEAGVVYCFSRDQVTQTTAAIQRQGIVAVPYHLGLDIDTRQGNAQRFLDEDGVVIVADASFGRGIDKLDVRFVAHLSLPRTLNDYWQQTRLPGIDGGLAEVWLAHDQHDVATHRKLIERRSMPDDQKAIAHRQLNEVIAYCEEKECRRTFLLKNLCGLVSEPCGNCDNCLRKSRLWDGSRYGTNDVNKHNKAIQRVTGIEFSRMGGFGKISCCECSFSGNNTSFLHGLVSEDGSEKSSTGYQCLSCGKFSTLDSGEPLKCQCGGILCRSHLLFCPQCKSTKLIYKMKYIT